MMPRSSGRELAFRGDSARLPLPLTWLADSGHVRRRLFGIWGVAAQRDPQYLLGLGRGTLIDLFFSRDLGVAKGFAFGGLPLPGADQCRCRLQ